MDCRKELYVDGVGQIHFAGGMVRIDFITIQPKEGETPETQVVQRVIVPPQGFLSMFGSMQQLIDKLVEAGVLQKREKSDSSVSSTGTGQWSGAIQKKEKTE